MPRKLKAPLAPLPRSSETVGQRIARTRRARGLTQKQLGERIGTERTLVTDYEIGRLRLSGEMIARFALALDVSTDFILGLSDMPSLPQKPDLKLTRRLREIERLPQRQRKSLLKAARGHAEAASLAPR